MFKFCTIREIQKMNKKREGEEMEKYYDLLYYLNQKEVRSQREIAAALGISVGRVNYLLRFLEEKEYLKKSGSGYQLTKGGHEVLEQMAKSNKSQKLSFPRKETHTLSTAVLLAAGENNAFLRPEGLLEIHGVPVIERLIRSMQELGVSRFVVVIGAGADAYRKYFQGREVELAVNERYPWTGTMESLACVAGMVKEDFLLVDANQILEVQGFRKLLESGEANGVLLASPSGSGDEAYVELDGEGSIFRISKDIRQLNRVDAEMVGVSKITAELFEKMLSFYRENENPYLNYEYVLENIGRIYRIPGIHADDLAWTVIENERLYSYAEHIVYPKIQKKEKLARENKAREILTTDLGILPEKITQVQIRGGMTNRNFYVVIGEKPYILRIPGACTESMINREREYKNTMEAAKRGFHPPVRCFHPDSGLKLTEYISGAQTLNGKSARLEKNIRLTAKLLKTLHESKMEMEGSFQVFREYQVYKNLIRAEGGSCYPGFGEMEEFLKRLEQDLERLGEESRPCHNDLVAENLVKDEAGRLYLIDWEYAGRNDPMWDLASHFLECSFREEEEALFLRYYFGGMPDEKKRQKIAVYKICQDMLWSAWTIAKEAAGEEFGTYGQERFLRAVKQRRDYEEHYR